MPTLALRYIKAHLRAGIVATEKNKSVYLASVKKKEAGYACLPHKEKELVRGFWDRNDHLRSKCVVTNKNVICSTQK